MAYVFDPNGPHCWHGGDTVFDRCCWCGAWRQEKYEPVPHGSYVPVDETRVVHFYPDGVDPDHCPENPKKRESSRWLQAGGVSFFTP